MFNYYYKFMKRLEVKTSSETGQTFVNLLTNGGFKAFFGDENITVKSSMKTKQCTMTTCVEINLGQYSS